MTGTLFVAATPIGNLEEAAPRLSHVMQTVDIIAAEDTRHSRQLAQLLGCPVQGKWVSLHKFNEAGKIAPLLASLREGANVLLVSDAGTPCISDPGYLFVQAAAAEGIMVTPVAGPSAVTVAVSVSGFPAVPFIFVGFLPRKAQELAQLPVHVCPTVVFYESPKRVAASVEALSLVFPKAQLCLCNDLTKKFERIYRGTPAEVSQQLAENPYAQKGEYAGVLYVPNQGNPTEADGDTPALSPEAHLTDTMVKTGCSLKEAVAEAAKTSAFRKNELYDAALRLKNILGA